MADEEVTLNGFGKSVSIKGLGTIIVLMLMVLTGGIGWMLYDLSHGAAQAVREAMQIKQETALEHKAIMDSAVAIKDNQATIMDVVKRVESSVKVQNWILLADPSEKTEIKQKMNMPRELREMGVRER